MLIANQIERAPIVQPVYMTYLFLLISGNYKLKYTAASFEKAHQVMVIYLIPNSDYFVVASTVLIST